MDIYKSIKLLILLSFANSFFSFAMFDFLNNLTEFNVKNRKATLDFLSGVMNNNSQQPNKYSVEDFEIMSKDPFDDIIGIPVDIQELANLINSPNGGNGKSLGMKIPKGILFYGPPGTGKTSIARALAKKVNAKFISAVGSDFIEVYVGVGPSRVRELFAQASNALNRGYKNAIIFIDEIDAIGGKRNEFGGGACTEYRSTLNALLSCMDGFEQNMNGSIIVIGATNTPEILDPALKRSGRFDRLIEIGLPDLESRKKLFELYLSKKPSVDKNLDINNLAFKTEGITGADIENIIEQAVSLAYREGAHCISSGHLESVIKTFMKQVRLRRK